MTASWFARLIPVTVAVGGVALAAMWLLSEPAVPKIVERVPGMDGTPPAVKHISVDLRGEIEHGTGTVPEELSKGGGASWPWFRGVNFNNIAPEAEAVRSWSAAGPAEVWEIKVGDGYAGAAIHQGRVYLLDYDMEKKADVLRCMSLADGKAIWTRSYPVEVKWNHGMSRTVPAVTDKYVVTIGPKCHVSCVDALTGEYQWGIDQVAAYQTKVPEWYAGQCPLIDGDLLILAPGGKEVLMMAVELATGKVVWQVANPHKWEMTHVSVVPMTLLGQKMYVYCGSNGVVAVDEAGGVVWETQEWKVKYAVASPVAIGEDRIFFSGGYKAGAMMMRLKKSKEGEGKKVESEVLYRLTEEEFGVEQQTPIFYKGYLYGVTMAKKGPLVCLDVETGKPVWNSGSEGFGSGPFMICGGQIWVVNDTGVLTVVEASPGGYRKLGQWAMFEEGNDAWGPLAVAEGRLLMRDFKRMICLNLREMR
ncbi:MAG: PQQ-like beta-propeller repeat protein [Phycisphaerales bacterium]|nr:PQQ-like beta-propeller repeat protein [Phycisphaerales bacterium]